MANYYDETYALYPKSGGGQGFSREAEVCDRGRQWVNIRGCVYTPQCIVRVSSVYYEGSYASTFLEIIKDGRIHYRRFKKDYTARYMVTLAKQFAKEVFNDE